MRKYTIYIPFPRLHVFDVRAIFFERYTLFSTRRDAKGRKYKKKKPTTRRRTKTR